MSGLKVVARNEADCGNKFFSNNIGLLLELLRRTYVSFLPYKANAKQYQINAEHINRLNKDIIEWNFNTILFKDMLEEENIFEKEDQERVKNSFINFVEYLKNHKDTQYIKDSGYYLMKVF